MSSISPRRFQEIVQSPSCCVYQYAGKQTIDKYIFNFFTRVSFRARTSNFNFMPTKDVYYTTKT